MNLELTRIQADNIHCNEIMTFAKASSAFFSFLLRHFDYFRARYDEDTDDTKCGKRGRSKMEPLEHLLQR